MSRTIRNISQKLKSVNKGCYYNSIHSKEPYQESYILYLKAVYDGMSKNKHELKGQALVEYNLARADGKSKKDLFIEWETQSNRYGKKRYRKAMRLQEKQALKKEIQEL